VVIVGAGFGGLEAAKALGKLPVTATIIDQNNFHLFQPMLYQVATAGLEPSDIANSVREILRSYENIEVVLAEVTGIETREHRVLLKDEQSIPYDYLILATGATSNYFKHPEWAQLAPGMKTLDDALGVRRLILTAFETAEREPDPAKRQRLLTFVLVGGGPTGVELSGALAELAHQSLKGNFRHIQPMQARIILVQGGDQILNGFPKSLARRSQKKLEQMGVEVIIGEHIEEVQEDRVKIKDRYIETNNVIWTAGVTASPAGKWLNAEVDSDGRVKVQPDMTVQGLDNVFVIGDTARTLEKGEPLPGVAQVAIQQGHYVASLIGEELAGQKQHKPFHYFDKGMLATVGRAYGVVDIGPIQFTGFIAWLTWILVHIAFLIGFRSRLLVLIQYAWSYFTFQRGARIILPGGQVRTPD
jgi:NADH dehydrogenase